MMTNVVSLNDRIDALRRQIGDRRDPFADVKRDVVIKADVTYDDGETTYTYVFLRTNGLWASTASRRTFDSWEKVLDFLSSHRVVNIYVADGWRAVIG